MTLHIVALAANMCDCAQAATAARVAASFMCCLKCVILCVLLWLLLAQQRPCMHNEVLTDIHRVVELYFYRRLYPIHSGQVHSFDNMLSKFIEPMIIPNLDA
ncbi:hypothetical protein DFH11DRAFT_998970 [Phellopilus nigrolimitatus]|nr:hypothetical protein DFH11DRAFT_998970 [Phellopilus nigrolimitatus]